MSNIFSIPSCYNFSKTFAHWLKSNFVFEGSDASSLKDLLVLMPNRRSCRLANFVSKECGLEGINIKPIGEISLLDFLIINHPNPQSLTSDFANLTSIGKIELLFCVVSEISNAQILATQNSRQSLKIAKRIADLFNQFEQEEIDIEQLDNIDASELAKHQQLNLGSIKNLYLRINQNLAKKQQCLPSQYQKLCTKAFTKALLTFGSKKPIIIAGSFGSLDFMNEFIISVGKQKNGYLILQNLEERNGVIAENDPQFFLHKILKKLDILPNSVTKIHNQAYLMSSCARKNIISLLGFVGDDIASWDQDLLDQKQFVKQEMEQNIQLLEAKNLLEESKTIANHLSKAIFSGQSCALVSNDHDLCDLVKLELKRLGAEVNDGRGQSVRSAKLIQFLLAVVKLLEEKFDSISLLSLLKHPLCFYHQKEIIYDFENKILRQDRISKGLSGIKHLIELNLKLNPDLAEFFKEFIDLLYEDEKLGLPHGGIAITKLVSLTERLSKYSWQELLDRELAKSGIEEFFNLLIKIDYKISSSEEFLSILSYIGFFEQEYDIDLSRVQILPTVEARLMNFDLTVIGAMNEGFFPKFDQEDWLSKRIASQLNLLHENKRFSQASYDFTNYLGNSRLILSRAINGFSSQNIESPLLTKFKILCSKMKASPSSALLEVQFADYKSEIIPLPNPRPKLELRPKTFSITEISKLASNPYQIYCSKILNLKPLKKIDYEPSYAEFGSFIHKALELFVKNDKAQNIDFEQILSNYFLSGQAKLKWWPKFTNVFSSFLRDNEQFKAQMSLLEKSATIRCGDVSIFGKIDRVIFEGDVAHIFDYKTGQKPSNQEVIDGFEMQLTLAALALAQQNIKVGSINYWLLSALKDGKISNIVKGEEKMLEVIEKTQIKLKSILEYFDDEENGYLFIDSEQRRSDYAHLARSI